MSGRFLENPAYVEYERMTLRLHRLISEGKDESDEADHLRERMDAPWNKLNAEERDRLDGVVMDLAPPPSAVGSNDAFPGQIDVAALDHARAIAYQRREWPRFLQLMRNAPTDLSPAFVAFSRYRAYEGLGHLEVALEFLRRAELLQPKDNYKGLMLELLRELNQFDEAVARALQYIDDSRSSANLIVAAAGALFASTRTISHEEARPRLEVAATALSKVLEGEAVAIRDPDARMAALVLLGLCKESINDFAGAEAAYNAASLVDPESQVVKSAKANLAAQIKRAAAGPGMLGSERALREKRYQIAQSVDLYMQAA